MLIKIITLPNNKQVLFLGLLVFQRWPEGNWERIDSRILNHVSISKESQVETLMVGK